MSEALKFLPPRVALTDPRTGLISREWYLFFQGIFDRVGGSTGSSTTDLSSSLFEDAGSGETNALLFAAEQALSQLPIQQLSVPDDKLLEPRYEPSAVEALQTELNGLRELVQELSKELDALKQATTL